MKTKTVFICSECGYQSPKWMGKCTACGSWNTMEEETVVSQKGPAAAVPVASFTSTPKSLKNIEYEKEMRYKTGMGELDRVLGGGLVKGSLVLVGGDPGIGKSTLLLQICQTMAENAKILYASGEESQQQIKLRAERLGITAENVEIYSENNMGLISDYVLKNKPDILICDSVQTMFNPEVSSAPGNITQIREVTTALMKIAKENGISVFLVGHVTKEGSLAGPKVLEHMVDTVLYFEGERSRSYRILRAVKNRFGSTNEIGVFEMNSSGLEEIPNPSAALLSERPENTAGSCIVCAMEGTRPVLSEVQALCSVSSFGNPRRMATGLDLSRVIMLLAVVEKRANLRLSQYDAYVNIVGGIRLNEPAVDLGTVLAIASSFKNSPVDPSAVAIGEVGLTGEIRSTPFMESRIKEAEKMGFKKCIIPAANIAKLPKFDKIKLYPFDNIKDAINAVIK